MPAPAPSGIIVTNPPYGVRLQDQQSLAELYPQLGDALKKKYAGWTAYIFTADLRLPKLIGLSPSRRTPLFNGALECRLFEYKMVAGSMRRKPADDGTERRIGRSRRHLGAGSDVKIHHCRRL